MMYAWWSPGGALAVTHTGVAGQDGECGISLESVLGSIHVYRCCSAAELMATCRLLPEFVKQHPNVRAAAPRIHRLLSHTACHPSQVKLVVLDSIAFHFRHDIQDMAARARILATLAQSFHELAYEKQLAVRAAPTALRASLWPLTMWHRPGCGDEPSYDTCAELGSHSGARSRRKLVACMHQQVDAVSGGRPTRCQAPQVHLSPHGHS